METYKIPKTCLKKYYFIYPKLLKNIKVAVCGASTSNLFECIIEFIAEIMNLMYFHSVALRPLFCVLSFIEMLP